MKYIEIEDALTDIHTTMIYIERKLQNPTGPLIIDVEIYNNTVVHIWSLLRHKTVRVPQSIMDLNI